MYATTLIRGNEGPARRWGLQQRGNAPFDANVFWKIDERGARMLRFDVWPAGAEVGEVIGMGDVIRRMRP